MSRLVLSFAIGLVLCAQLPAQDTTAESPRGISASFAADFWRIDIKGGFIIAMGHVQLRWKNGSLRCDSAVIWTDSTGDEYEDDSKAEGRLHVKEIYAEGNILLIGGEIVRSLEASAAFVDPVHERALLLDVTQTLEVEVRSGTLPIVVRAREAIQRSRRLFELQDLRFTTSPFVHPGWRVETSRLAIQIDPPAQKPGGEPGETVRNVRYEVDSSVVYLGELPLLPLPSLAGNTADSLGVGWLKGAGFDRSSRFGPSIYLDVGTDIDDSEGRKWGEWTLRNRYLFDRGPGVGLDLKYRGEDYRGGLVTFYQNDDGRDTIVRQPHPENRGRFTWRHRHKLPESIQLDLELSAISDRGFLPEYYENEFKGGKDQETLLYFKRAVENRALTALASVRINEFLDQVEHQPQIGYNLISEPIFELGGSALYFDADWEISRARRRFDPDSLRADQDAFRADLDNTIGLPFFVGPVKLEPFAGFRYTYYSKGRLTDDSFNRIGTVYGIRATTQIHRSWDVQGGLFGLDGLQHVILPELEYIAVDQVSVAPSALPQFDRIDRFTQRETLRVGVRNRLQTVWRIDEVAQVVDFVDLDVEWTYFPQADRDNGGSHAGNLDVDFVLRPGTRLTWLVDFEYSFQLDTFEVFNTTLGWLASQDLFLAVGYRRFVDVNDAVFFQAEWKLSPRLAIVYRGGYDFADGEIQDQRLRFRRMGQDWVFEVELSVDNTENFGFSINIIPRGLFDPRIRSRPLRHEPRFATFGDGLLKR